MLAAAFGRHIGNGALDDFKQGLLHAFAGNIPGDGRCIGLAGDLVNLIDIDDAARRPVRYYSLQPEAG